MTSAMGRDGAPRSTGNGASTDPGQLQQAATGLMDQATRTADAQASTRMTMAGETLDGIGRAIRDASEGLREQQPELAKLTDTAAERVQGAATYLRDHSASEALQGAQQYARRQPALVVGGGLLAGLLLGRFLRTGASVAQSNGQRQLTGGSGHDSTHGASAGTTYGYGAGVGSGLASMPTETDLPLETESLDSLDDLGDTKVTGATSTTNEAR